MNSANKSFMDSRIIVDISNFIFVSDEPKTVDAIFLPGGSHPEQPEYAAKLYNKGLAKYVIPAGGVSVKRDKWPGVRSKAEIYNGDYKTDCEFFTDVLIKNGVPRTAIYGEDKSGHTRDNAFLSRNVVNDNGLEIKMAIIACKAFHARRCLRHKRVEPGTVLKRPLFAVTASKSLAMRQHCFVFFLVPTKI